MVSSTARLGGVVAGMLLDSLLGEPPVALHPVAWFGRSMERLERVAFAPSRTAGTRYALAGASLGVVSGLGVRYLAARALGGLCARARSAPSVLQEEGRTPLPRTGRDDGIAREVAEALGEALATCAAVYVACAGRELLAAGRRVEAELREGDLESARLRVREIVGRDTEFLDEEGVCRAVVESVAENTVDAVVGAAFFGAIWGAPGALCYRAINTMDAMVGHRSERYLLFGWASAKADDLAGYVPARLCALAVALLRPSRARAVVQAVGTDARRHPSPNAGVAEAAFAGALGVLLGGKTSYDGEVEERPLLGSGRPPRLEDIGRASRLSMDVTALVALVLAALAARRRARTFARG